MKTCFLRSRQQGRQPITVAGLLFLLNLLLPGSATSGEVILSAIGNGQWQISAIGLTNVHALDLDFRYDVQRLSGLSVNAGAGLTGIMTAINNKVPGAVRLGVASTQPLPQNAVLLKLQSSVPGAELVVSFFTVKTVDVDGKVVPTVTRQQLPVSSSPQQTLSGSQTGTTSTATASQPLSVTRQRGGTVSGSMTLPAESSPPGSSSGDEEPTPFLPSSPVSDQNGEAALSASAAGIPVTSGPEKRFHSQEEIVTAIDRLPRPWRVAAIKAIFLKPATSKLARQQPPVVLADGKSKVSLYLPKSLSQNTPTVGVQGCTLGTIWDAKEQGWEVELVTRDGVWPAKALLLGDGDLIQFPIVIVPALVLTPPENDDIAIPSIDFDGDRSITALDAYLYVGNLLAQP